MPQSRDSSPVMSALRALSHALGNPGGGKKGVTGDNFRAWYGKRPVPAIKPNGDTRLGFVVLPIGAHDPTRFARAYADSVSRFKALVKHGQFNVTSRNFQARVKRFKAYREEPRGRRTGYRYGEIDYYSHHGEVVDALRVWRAALPLKKHQRILNDLFDLGVIDREHKLVEVYEVKTNAGPLQYLYRHRTTHGSWRSRLREIPCAPEGQAENARAILLVPCSGTTSL